ncbi:MAG: S9 family peptidase [Candidatus Dadabacteria bacterium]
MKRALVLICCSICLKAFNQVVPPSTKKIPVVYEEFGNKRTDNYSWMSNKSDPAVLEYIKQENEYTAKILQPLQPLQDKLFEEMKNRQAKSFSSLPVKLNGYWYYNRTEEGKSYPVYYRRKGNMTAKEEVIQDANVYASGLKPLYFLQPEVSRDNRLAAFRINTTGDRRFTIKIKDLVTGKMLPDSINNAAYNLVWANDNKHFFYTINDKTVRPYKVLLHTLGRPMQSDVLIREEKDSTFGTYIYPSSDRKYLFIENGSSTSSEMYYLHLSGTHTSPILINRREPDLVYYIIDHLNGSFYGYTNYKAPNYRVVKSAPGETNKDQWQEVIGSGPDVYIQPSIQIKNRKIISSQRLKGSPVINVYDLLTGKSYNIDFQQEAYSVYFSSPDDNPLSDSIRFQFSSYATPQTDYAYNLTNRKKSLIRQEEVNNFSPANYETKMLQVPVRDGTIVPVSMVYNKSAYTADGTHPLLLYTYSWYGAVFDPTFNNSLISLLDRGFAYVYVHARGGAEKGASWWKEGRRMNRNNTYYDIVDAAQYLVDKKYTSPAKMVAMGKSAGGTNIGVLVNLRPDLFKAVIADVPWVDVITDMKNPDIPTVTAEYEEEGNPNIQSEYNYMLTWSPYDNIKKAEYPYILAIGGWNDTNVPFYHAAKWVAKIREHNTGKSPVLLMVNLDAGHGGTSDRFGRMKTTALQYAFLLDAVGAAK